MTAQQPARNAFTYQPHLDGLRAISILLVVIGHAGLGHLIPGGFGVTVFFFISGYLITSLLLAERERTGTIDLMQFYLRRFWRLAPPVFVHVGLSALFIILVGAQLNWIEPASVLFYFSNYYKVFITYDSIKGAYSPFTIYWSLAVEEHFYLFFTPILILLKDHRKLIIFILMLIVIPLFIRFGVTAYFGLTGFSENYTYSASDTRMDSIAYGCFLAALPREVIAKMKIQILFYISIIGILASFLIRDETFRQVYRFSLQGICLFFVISALLFSTHFNGLVKLLSTRWLVYIGKISYSLYLYHWLVIVGLGVAMGNHGFSWQWHVAYWVLTFAMSALSYHYIELPTVAMRRKYGSHPH
jgi:peptidoglycan/LPS O-acetylase OafA/YrhL